MVVRLLYSYIIYAVAQVGKILRRCFSPLQIFYISIILQEKCIKFEYMYKYIWRISLVYCLKRDFGGLSPSPQTTIFATAWYKYYIIIRVLYTYICKAISYTCVCAYRLLAFHLSAHAPQLLPPPALIKYSEDTHYFAVIKFHGFLSFTAFCPSSDSRRTDPDGHVLLLNSEFLTFEKYNLYIYSLSPTSRL